MTNVQRKRTTSEVCTFILFTLFLIICVTLQLKVPEKYENNVSIGNWINNASFFDEKRGFMTLDQLYHHQQLLDWLEGFLTQEMQKSEEYPGMRIPEYRMNSISRKNILIGPVRLTQRMVKQAANTNSLTAKATPKVWAHPTIKLSSTDPFDVHHEFKEDATPGKQRGGTKTFKYTTRDSYFELGGYVEQLDVYALSKQEIRARIQGLRDHRYINDQTCLVTIDMMFMNPYSEIYTIVAIQANFYPSGRMQVTDINYMNVISKFYNWSKSSNIIRLLCEVLFVLILVIYIVI